MASAASQDLAKGTARSLTQLPLAFGPNSAENHGVNISSVATNLPESVSSPADALAFIAVKKGLDMQKAAAAAILALLDPNVGTKLNARA